MKQALRISKETVLQQSSLGFDLSIAQIAVALTGGGILFIASRAQRGDAIDLARLIRSELISSTFCVPSEYALMLRFGQNDLEQCPNWRLAIIGGEILTVQLKRTFHRLNSGLNVVNAYGPTETTMVSHLTRVNYELAEGSIDTSEDVLDEGRPLPNVSTYIVDYMGQLVPIGFPGEIYIRGLGVSPGHHRDHQSTQERFVPNTFDAWKDHTIQRHATRLYRSGDRGRLLANGSLIPLGRINGYH